MVSWQRFVGIAFDVAKGKGGEFEGIDDGADFVTGLSELWGEDKDSLKQMTERQVRTYLEERVQA